MPYLTSLGEAVNHDGDDSKFNLILSMFIRDYYYKEPTEKIDVEQTIKSNMESYFRPEIRKLKNLRGVDGSPDSTKDKNGNSKTSKASGENCNDVIEIAASDQTVLFLPLSHRVWM